MGGKKREKMKEKKSSIIEPDMSFRCICMPPHPRCLQRQLRIFQTTLRPPL